MDVLIVGAGVSGLSAAVRLLEAGHRARVVAREPSLATTSSVAAAVWYPYRAFPEHLVLGWGAATYAELTRLAESPASGVVVRPGLELFRRPAADPWWAPAVPDFRRAAPAELPPGFADGYAFSAPVVEMPRYLPFLTGRLMALGGAVEVRPVASLAELRGQADAIVDCAGLGARELAGDASLTPIRGQIVRVAQVGVERFTLDEDDPAGVTYIVPRAADIVLGGTSQEGREDTAPEPPTAEAIMARCAAIEPRLREARVLEHRVGLRPGRPAVRLERDRSPDWAATPLVHCYGHGGAGVTLSWGCADEVVRLLEGA